MSRYFFLSFFVLTFFFSISIYAQDDSGVLSLNVEGIAAITRSDVARARKEAINDALGKAILETASKLLSIPVKDERFQAVKSVIIDQPEKYVNNYKISTEIKQTETYVVNVNVIVTLVTLKNDLYKMGFLQEQQKQKTNLIVSLSVKGLKKYSDFFRLREFLKSRTKIVKNIYPCRFEWQQVHFEIEILEDPQFLVDELVKTNRYMLEIQHTYKNHIEMTCL
jgi:hypothetical protein